ncbi:hypothetical protein P1P68_27370 [Streptomyces scabiei]|uniref:hypothetical protein n=1 Tax=Streptomyces scabiei TaxID=1930 RepID=UPI00298FB41D|nr:hypothetical protein [Streptomyces scabiei]MDW8808408.1 hypothetical protein [Streptomyces scabiei]
MSSQTSIPTLTRPADTGCPVLPPSLPHPVTALVTNRPEDLTVVDTAVRMAAPRKAPVLLVAILPPPSQIPDRARADAVRAARVSSARVLPRLRAAGIGYIPVAPPPGRERRAARAEGRRRCAGPGHTPPFTAGGGLQPGTGRSERT